MDEEDQRELDEAKARRTAFKNKVRATIAVQDAMTGDREHGVLLKDRENALRVASIIEMLRADDEGLERSKICLNSKDDKKFETRLVDERGQKAPRAAVQQVSPTGARPERHVVALGLPPFIRCRGFDEPRAAPQGAPPVPAGSARRGVGGRRGLRRGGGRRSSGGESKVGRERRG